MNTASVIPTTAGVAWPGGRGFFAVTATFGAGSVALETLAPDGSTWIAVPNAGTGAAISFTAAGGALFELPPCRIRLAVVTATGVNALASRIPV